MATSDALWLSKICNGDPFWQQDDDHFRSLLRGLDIDATPVASPRPTLHVQGELMSESDTVAVGDVEDREDFKSKVSDLLLRARTSIHLMLDEALLEAAASGNIEATSSGLNAVPFATRLMSRIEAHILSEIPSPNRLNSSHSESRNTNSQSIGKRSQGYNIESEAEDTDASWAGSEVALEKYSQLIENRLEDCLFASLLLPNLTRRQRQTLRAQTHMKRLNHVSFGKGKCRCLFISRHTIASSTRRPRTGSYFVDPAYPGVCNLTSIAPMMVRESDNRPHYVIDWSYGEYNLTSSTKFRHILENNRLAQPAAESWPALTFQKASDVAEICSVLHDCPIENERRRNVLHRCLKICVWPDQMEPNSRDLQSLNLAQYPLQLHLAGSSINTSTLSEMSDIDARSIADANLRSSIQPDSELRNRKRQRRIPREESGYRCRHPTCNKSFDLSGNRRKHEASHDLHKRRHICEQCGKRFMYPKDLRRHLSIHDRAGSVSDFSEDSLNTVESRSQFEFQVQDLYPTPSTAEHLSPTASTDYALWSLDDSMTPVSTQMLTPCGAWRDPFWVSLRGPKSGLIRTNQMSSF